MYVTSILCVFLYWLHVSKETSIPIHTYDSLLSHLTSGTRVTYFFNTTTCQPVTPAATVDLPVFGGEINFFLTSKGEEGQLVFNHDSYFVGSDDTDAVNEEIQSIYIVEYTAMILYGKSGVFANNTENIKLVICNWTAENTFWAKESTTLSQLGSYEEIRKSLTVGDAIRFVITTSGCKCQAGDDCGNVYFGGDLRDFKVKPNGMITFSKSMTVYFPIPTSPMYYRELLIGQIQPNNTVTMQLLYANATTWEIGNGAEMVCSIQDSRGHADFFRNSV